MTDIEIKRGDTFSLDVTRVDSAGAPVDCTGMTITSAVELGAFSAPLTVTAVDLALGQFRLSATAAETATWPVALISADVKYDLGGVIQRSRTFAIMVAKEVTA